MKRINTIVYIITAIAFLLSCTPRKRNFAVIEGAMLGTNLRVVADIETSPRELYAAAMNLDRTLKAEMSIFDSTSLLSRINRGECDSLTEGLIYNLRLSDSISTISNGAYDVTVMPLVRALGFAGDDPLKRANIDSILKFVGHDKIKIKGNKLIREDIRTQIDLNSIAKGYTVDRLAALAESLGANNYIIDIGGEIRCKGSNAQGNPWRIGIETPFDGNMTNGEYVEKRIMIPDSSKYKGMATSGNYRRFYLDSNGNKIAHTIDPRSGRSVVSRLLSATVIAPTCALADGYGTMFMALGADKAIELSSTIEDAEVYFILADTLGGYEEYYSRGMKKFIME